MRPSNIGPALARALSYEYAVISLDGSELPPQTVLLAREPDPLGYDEQQDRINRLIHGEAHRRRQPLRAQSR